MAGEIIAWERTNRAVFGTRGGLYAPEVCPLGRRACAPDTGRNSEHFLGHGFKGDRAYVGDVVPICCDLLRPARPVTKTEGE